jgi:hypothetical protein
MKKNLLFSLIFSFSLFAFVQYGTLDIAFNSTNLGFGNEDRADNAISETAIQSGGKIIIGGE